MRNVWELHDSERNCCLGRDGGGGKGVGKASAMSFFFFFKESVVNRVKYK